MKYSMAVVSRFQIHIQYVSVGIIHMKREFPVRLLISLVLYMEEFSLSSPKILSFFSEN